MRLLFFVEPLLRTMSDAMQSLQEDIDRRALPQWTIATETSLEGIPGYLTIGRNTLFFR
jgi:hypothetical protein